MSDVVDFTSKRDKEHMERLKGIYDMDNFMVIGMNGTGEVDIITTADTPELRNCMLSGAMLSLNSSKDQEWEES